MGLRLFERKKILPCSRFNMAKIQDWLTEQARAGRYFRGYSSITGLATFDDHLGDYGDDKSFQGRYEVELGAKSRTGIPYYPDDEERQIHENAGWHFAGPMQEFAVYYTEDPNTRPLNTDSELFRSAMQRFLRNSVIGRTMVLSYIVMFFCLSDDNLFRQPILLCQKLLWGELVFVILLVMLGYWLVINFLDLRFLLRCRNRELDPFSIPFAGANPKHALLRYCSRWILVACFVLILMSLWFVEAGTDNVDGHYTPPFTTMKEVVLQGQAEKDGASVDDQLYGYECTYQNSSGMFVSEYLDWYESGSTRDTGESYYLYLEYVRCKGAWATREVMREYRRQDGGIVRRKPYPYQKIDGAAWSCDELYMLKGKGVYLARKGNTVVWTEYYGAEDASDKMIKQILQSVDR